MARASEAQRLAWMYVWSASYTGSVTRVLSSLRKSVLGLAMAVLLDQKKAPDHAAGGKVGQQGDNSVGMSGGPLIGLGVDKRRRIFELEIAAVDAGDTSPPPLCDVLRGDLAVFGDRAIAAQTIDDFRVGMFTHGQ
mgnify:CR=1 FL=1